jgi:site-specific recombinase
MGTISSQPHREATEQSVAVGLTADGARRRTALVAGSLFIASTVAFMLASALNLVNQGDILATAVSRFPVWDLGGLVGSYLWAVWLVVIGVLLFRRVNHNAR